MQHLVCKESQVWKQSAIDWLARRKSSGAKSLYLPAGQTAVPLYEELNHAGSALDGLQLLQIDEVLTGSKAGLFQQFFQSYLGRLPRGVADLHEGQIQADLAWLGLGLNGHVGFHEPGIDPRFYSGCVQLSSKSTDTLGLEKDAWGVTYGLGAFMSCKSVLILVRGPSKAEVLKRLLENDRSLPATHLLDHPDLTILSDF